MIRATLSHFSGRSRSSKPPPRVGDLLGGDPLKTGPDASRGVILYLEDITVSFDGFKALNALTLYVEVGELRCIIGPNGAGKTTMMDVITGKTRPAAGSAWFGQTIDLLAHTEPGRHWPQIPETHSVRAPHGIRKSGARHGGQ
jgi:urea transport system ATP-binding protein